MNGKKVVILEENPFLLEKRPNPRALHDRRRNLVAFALQHQATLDSPPRTLVVEQPRTLTAPLAVIFLVHM
ncbi:hypothetical protein AKJ09_09392 [Labilithrix luteola]|uniref:Uncharacterized protein n=1 Tax=Labilithrix luteola TaxID=1391654 RepID=A0A0K1QAH0_9BACT|nr:hypothetical protein AKJ09_09392 [Labilithrix luteola]